MTLPSTSDAVRRPRVDTVTSRLRALIAEERARGGDRLPPEKELSEQLGTSRGTLREALATLEAAGEIERRRRVGTLITAPQRFTLDRAIAYPIDHIRSVSSVLGGASSAHTVRRVSVHREAADDESGPLLGLAAGAPVFRVSRSYEVDGGATALVEHTLPATLNGHEVRINSLTDGVTTFFRDVEHIPLARSDHAVTAIAATGELAAELEVAPGAPLLVVYCRLFGDDERIIALGRLVFRPDALYVTASAYPVDPDGPA
ncbi:GntR family transcriptional regulator [Jiangella endophytica]|uniref:GntR family transcriptional regulator n=1 Tax=Jiangella endophytica TaxID=1623398 RepID=UPI000E345CC3|nr:GntR family transcriptional regulator [Jiangella endophytica]